MLNHTCETLPGVGPTLAAKLAKLNIFTLQNLLFHLPYRYQDRTRITPICDLRPNEWCVIGGEVFKSEIKFGKHRMLYCHVQDKTGFLKLRFFHFNQHQLKSLNTNKKIRAFGEVRTFANQLEMIHPEYQLLDNDDEFTVEETLTPIYPSTQGLTQSRLRQLIKQVLKTYESEIRSLEWMTDNERQQYAFPSLGEAIIELHQPPPDVAIKNIEEGTYSPLKRLVFDELLAQQLSMRFARQQQMRLKAPAFNKGANLATQFLTNLPFALTKAQQRVYQEIQIDLQKSKPMLRLLQGDVGAGKTIIAALASLEAIAEGYQVALMAPTDILSEQHQQSFLNWFSKLGIHVLRLNGKMKQSESKKALAAIEQNHCQMIIGTHALFQDAVKFNRLGLVIIDEHHRFGVEQRLLLQKKGENESYSPHQLFMTATPIPRTLAMTHYAHLDLSIIDELPPNRTPIITAILSQAKREPVITRLENAIAQGRQAYWVCTLIEESEKLQCMAATETAQNLQQQLTNVRIGLVHGRMHTKEKEKTMHDFKQGEIDLLVSTTVIEVGVDVPNASLMIIENAERLGLSQLHQLRGRIGRGTAQSHCLLLYQSPLSPLANARLQIIRDSNDGFEIAEKDLAIRGQGEVLGVKQTGYRSYKIADLQRDKHLLPTIKEMAVHIFRENPHTAQKIATRWLGQYEQFLQS